MTNTKDPHNLLRPISQVSLSTTNGKKGLSLIV